MLGATATALAVTPEEVRVQFDSGDGQWLSLPDVIAGNDYDLSTDQQDDGSVLAVRIDLNGDGAAEWFVRTLCGNGGCDYPIFDGKNGRHLGNVFGSRVWLLKQTTHGLPVIETFSREAASDGAVTRYEYDGAHYVPGDETDFEGEEETETLYRALAKVPQWQPPGGTP